jgi:hypothetical protein
MDPLALSRGSRMEQHASGQMQPYIRPLEDIPYLRALMKSALPHLITTAASRALYLCRLGGSRSDRSCHQLDVTSPGAEGLLDLSVTLKSCANTFQRPVCGKRHMWRLPLARGQLIVLVARQERPDNPGIFVCHRYDRAVCATAFEQYKPTSFWQLIDGFREYK